MESLRDVLLVVADALVSLDRSGQGDARGTLATPRAFHRCGPIGGRGASCSASTFGSLVGSLQTRPRQT